MHMRFVRLRVKEGGLDGLSRFYDENVIPALQETDGCLFASLLETTEDDDEVVSLTLWRNAEVAEVYEKSGLFDRLLDGSDEFLAGAAEWRVQLTGDRGDSPKLVQEPAVETMPVEIAALGTDHDDTPPELFVRIVALRLKEGRFAELRERYNELVVPELLATKGCRAVFLVEGIAVRSRALSVTVWETENDAIRYELMGRFEDLISKLSDYLEGLYEWDVSLDSPKPAQVDDEAIEIRGYRLVTGRRFEG